MKKRDRCRSVTSSRILWQAPPSPYPPPPLTGGEGEKVEPARRPLDRENLAESVGWHRGMLAVLHAGDRAARRGAMEPGWSGKTARRHLGAAIGKATPRVACRWALS